MEYLGMAEGGKNSKGSIGILALSLRFPLLVTSTVITQGDCCVDIPGPDLSVVADTGYGFQSFHCSLKSLSPGCLLQQ